MSQYLEFLWYSTHWGCCCLSSHACFIRPKSLEYFRKKLCEACTCKACLVDKAATTVIFIPVTLQPPTSTQISFFSWAHWCRFPGLRLLDWEKGMNMYYQRDLNPRHLAPKINTLSLHHTQWVYALDMVLRQGITIYLPYLLDRVSLSRMPTTVKTLIIGTPRLTTIVVLNIKQFNFTIT